MLQRKKKKKNNWAMLRKIFFLILIKKKCFARPFGFLSYNMQNLKYLIDAQLRAPLQPPLKWAHLNISHDDEHERYQPIMLDFLNNQPKWRCRHPQLCLISPIINQNAASWISWSCLISLKLTWSTKKAEKGWILTFNCFQLSSRPTQLI